MCEGFAVETLPVCAVKRATFLPVSCTFVHSRNPFGRNATGQDGDYLLGDKNWHFYLLGEQRPFLTKVKKWQGKPGPGLCVAPSGARGLALLAAVL